MTILRSRELAGMVDRVGAHRPAWLRVDVVKVEESILALPRPATIRLPRCVIVDCTFEEATSLVGYQSLKLRMTPGEVRVRRNASEITSPCTNTTLLADRLAFETASTTQKWNAK